MPSALRPRVAPSERVYVTLRAAILHGEVAPAEPLRPQELADVHGVSLAVVREALLRLVGEGLAERLTNRGFIVPAVDAEGWHRIAEARAAIEPTVLRMSIARGGLEWEARVRAAHHRLVGTPIYEHPGDVHPSDAASEVHRQFHRTLLEGCDNDVLLGTFDRLFTAGELARRWSASRAPDRDAAAEHRALEQAALDRDADRAADTLIRHLGLTIAALTRAEPNRRQGA